MNSKLIFELTNFWKNPFLCWPQLQKSFSENPRNLLESITFWQNPSKVKIYEPVLEKTHVAEFLYLSQFAHNMARKNACQLKTCFQ